MYYTLFWEGHYKIEFESCTNIKVNKIWILTYLCCFQTSRKAERGSEDKRRHGEWQQDETRTLGKSSAKIELHTTSITVTRSENPKLKHDKVKEWTNW